MQQFMLQRLQTEIARLKNQQRMLIATSRATLTSQSRIHAAVLAMLGAPSFEHLIQIVTNDLAMLLDADVITLGVESVAAGQTHLSVRGVQILGRGTVEQLFGADRDVLLHGEIEGDPLLFGSGAGLLRSPALLRLPAPRAPQGSRPRRFPPLPRAPRQRPPRAQLHRAGALDLARVLPLPRPPRLRHQRSALGGADTQAAALGAEAAQRRGRGAGAGAHRRARRGAL